MKQILASLALVIVPLYLVAWIAVSYLAPYEDYVYESKQIVAINDTAEIHGSSFLFSGRIDEKPAYWYYEKDGGYMRLKSISADQAIIRYTTGEPRIDSYRKRFTSNWLKYVFIATSSYAKVIKIPQGSIVEDYTLDLEK